MDSNNEELKKLDKKMLKLNLIGFPGAVFLGLGLFGLFTETPSDLHSLLGHEKFVYLLIFTGALIEIWQFTKILPLLKKRTVLTKRENK